MSRSHSTSIEADGCPSEIGVVARLDGADEGSGICPWPVQERPTDARDILENAESAIGSSLPSRGLVPSWR
jgi:hypothetical protein